MLTSYKNVQFAPGASHFFLAAEVMARRKCGILNFTKAAQLDVGLVVLHYLAAASDPNDAVARLGEDLLKKRCLALLPSNGQSV